MSVAGTALPAEASITNVQTTGVDEGDIVKKHGDHLIVLRRGRLFTIRIGGDALQPVSAVNAYAPDADPNGTWYDEMLVSDDTVVVIGYSYARGGTEIGLFDLDASGGLRYRATYQLRSNDYYSARNYASRLIGNRLIFYTPLQISPWRLDSSAFLPALRHWRHDATPQDFKRILPATRIYRTDAELDLDDGSPCTRSVSAIWRYRRCVANRQQCSARAGMCSTCRKTRCTCGPRSGRRDVETRCLVGVPHSPRWQRTERAEGQRQPDRPDVVPATRRLPQRAGRQ